MGRWESQSVIYLMVWIIILVSFCVCVCVCTWWKGLFRIPYTELQCTSAIIPDPLSKNYRCSRFNFRPSSMYCTLRQPYISSGDSSYSSQLKLILEIQLNKCLFNFLVTKLIIVASDDVSQPFISKSFWTRKGKSSLTNIKYLNATRLYCSQIG